MVVTENGTIKCRTVTRLPNDEGWQNELVTQMKGVPWEPAPGRKSQHIFVEIRDDGQTLDKRGENESVIGAEAVDETDEMELRNKTEQIHISREAITKYGPTEGCPARNWPNSWAHKAGKLAYSHSTACRQRIVEKMKEDTECRTLIPKHAIHKEPGDL